MIVSIRKKCYFTDEKKTIVIKSGEKVTVYGKRYM